VLLDDYGSRTWRAKRRDTAASQIANGRLMVARFTTLDQDEPMPRSQAGVVSVTYDFTRTGSGVNRCGNGVRWGRA
jgi:hypothetical protein